MKNKYVIRAHISERKFWEVLKYFSADQTASQVAVFTGLNRYTVNKLFHKFRIRIVHISVMNAPELGEFEVDESYFGARRDRGRQGRGAAAAGSGCGSNRSINTYTPSATPH